MFVKVTAELASPLCLSDDGVPPHLDAICEFALAGRAKSINESRNGHRHPIAKDIPGQPVKQQGTLPIPIRRTWCDSGRGFRVPVPHCTQGILPPTRQTSEHFHCSFPIDRAWMLREKDQTVHSAGGGPLKSHRLPLRITQADRVVWFAELRRKKGRSPMSELRVLLRREVWSVGNKTAFGFGVVGKWIVEPAQIDSTWVIDGVLMRPIPLAVFGEASGYRRCFGAVSSPYWQRDYWCERVIPC